MSYCRKEGKDIIIFATEDDLSSPSTIELLPDDPNQMDSSSQGAILPNGEINWDCPCLGNLPHGPCGPDFKEAFTCWAETRDDQDAFVEKCYDNFTKWEECLAENRDIYRPSTHEEDKEPGKNDSPSNNTPSAIESATDTSETEDLSLSVPQATKSSEYESRSAIAAAYVDVTPK